MRRKAPPPARRAERLPSAHGQMSRQAYARLKGKAIAVEPLVRQAGLTRQQLDDPHASIAVRDQIKFLNLAAAALQDDLLGFHLAQMPDLRAIGLLYYLLASSETLLDGLQRVARYSTIVNEGVIQTCTHGTELSMSFRYHGVSRHLDRHQLECWTAGLMRICRELTGLRLAPSRVRMIHQRGEDQAAELSTFFGKAIEFGAPVDDVAFPHRFAEARILSADPYLNKLLLAYCEDALSHRRRAGTFRASVENAIAPLLPHGKANVEAVARQLGLSPRTLARRLSEEGTSFSDVLEGLRNDLAARYLGEKDFGIAQIAWLLGYEETSAFSRAFKRWTGKTPRDMRVPRKPLRKGARGAASSAPP
ncbi:MAG: AraC family transcriptional regulator ligand-binding domain-containing protein [Alphaproteobacteria bacterium]